MSKKINLKNIFFLVMIFYVCYIFVNQQITMNTIKAQINEKNIEMNKLKDKNRRLQDEVKMSQTDLYIEKLAREKLKLIKPGETPVLNSK
ncbi:cell division protein FtsL [Clostridium tetanomorphum]|uniref:Septum formation initiator family protein n=1 Tax=Clostridium tetanomorphum TaxID=1553 RepID=A0A923EDE5_CLOTT|nr:septum formation initiator family protein [Clostridium tetanomorphum]KAJ50947.1 putative cell division protein FtsL [Clostridium tetanomorphum DSM 665]MBC2400024.1 septum formation initiator family protein [Clostridium tetanomorphum]MBP1866472.1 cell division protein FtsL [Clostridium tetanomorphum]NRS86406.1 cell division protein FtsL [Clostridium tetanomorphum]NRZ95565.1 cell division protein FtsL [Clostridium tetanomorphum]